MTQTNLTKTSIFVAIKIAKLFKFFLTMYKDHFMSLTSEVSIVELDKALKG